MCRIKSNQPIDSSPSRLSIPNETALLHVIGTRKKISKRVSTNKSPCVQHGYNTCQNMEDYKLVLEKYHCKIPILYSGHHLDHLIKNETPNCNENMTRVKYFS